MIPFPEVFAYVDSEPMVVATFGGDVEWSANGNVVMLPTDAGQELAEAEPPGEVDLFDGPAEPPFDGRGLVDVDTGGRV